MSGQIETAFPVTRAAALARLAEFLPQAGADYARLRNLDRGPGQHVHVSRLSAALRRRVISEAEVTQAVLARHGLKGGEKFLSEVFWRGYWKGWLEQRPAIWASYRAAVTRQRKAVEADPELHARLLRALEGQTGIDCFDHWLVELRQTGYLHNWARMQFASIWVFTLGLPWELGAEVTLGLLTDGDPASNTLSWRWVAGLHTPGKAYLADAGRIAALTGGRFAPQGLARLARLPSESLTVPAPGPIRAFLPPDPSLPTLVWLTPEDLSPETEPALAHLRPRALVHLPGTTAADRLALADAAGRGEALWQVAARPCPDLPALVEAALSAGCRQIVTPYLPVGPVAAELAALRPLAEARGLRLAEHLRDWDRRLWPDCRKGFFALKEQMARHLSAPEEVA